MDELDRVAIRDGHRELLATFREMLPTLTRAHAPPDAETLRAAVAFLRQSVIPFARLEEHAIGGRGEAWEHVSFEHAFLTAEIEALVRAANRLLAGTAAPDDLRADADEVRRFAYRIEVVLELHSLKQEEHPLPALPRGAAEDFIEAERRFSRLREMPEAEIAEFLRARDWAMFCTGGAGRPYAVPISYGYRDGVVYMATGPGRKADNLMVDDRASLTVAEVYSGARWRSVVIDGWIDWVNTEIERARGLAAIRRQWRGPFGESEELREADAAVIRMTPLRVTGRARGM